MRKGNRLVKFGREVGVKQKTLDFIEDFFLEINTDIMASF